MLNKTQLQKMRRAGRTIGNAKAGDQDLGALQLLPGLWKNLPGLAGHGWNMIALPFASKFKPPINYRLLLNRYNEELRFSIVDKAVPNRGIKKQGQGVINADQLVATLEYGQSIKQEAAADFPVSGLAGPAELPIHREPGLFLHMANETKGKLEYARLGSIPHGNTILALGKSKAIQGPPRIPRANGLPIGVEHNLDDPYLAPYKHFHEHLFQDLFDPTRPNKLLRQVNSGVEIVRTTELQFDTKFATGGVVNIPFVTRQADASQMSARFWIQELKEKDSAGNPKLRLQYTQTVLLDFFPRADGKPGLIKWPHISINTLEKA